MKTFRNLSKHKQHRGPNNVNTLSSSSTINHNSNNLICPNCYNIEIINEKASYHKHSQPIRSSNESTFEDKHKLTHLQAITNKISSRDKHSQSTYNKLSLFTPSTPKEQLQRNFENTSKHNFFSTNKDYSRDRALTHHLQSERYINQHTNNFTFQTEKPNVLAYYEHYVDNYQTEPNECKDKYGSSNYYQELRKQIELKKNNDKERQRKEVEEDKKILQQQKDMFSERDMKDKKERMRMQNEFNDYNKKIMEDNRNNKEKRRNSGNDGSCERCYVDGGERRKLMGKCSKCNKSVPSNVLSISPRKHKLKETNKLKY